MGSELDKFRLPFYNPLAVIAAGATESAVVDLGNHTLCGLIVPAGMTSTALTFLVSVDGTNFYQMRQISGEAYTVDIDTDAACYSLGPQDVSPARYVKIVGASAEVAERTLQLISLTAASSL